MGVTSDKFSPRIHISVHIHKNVQQKLQHYNHKKQKLKKRRKRNGVAITSYIWRLHLDVFSVKSYLDSFFLKMSFI